MNEAIKPVNRHWSGILCPQTAEGIAKTIQEILNGKFFCVSYCSRFNEIHGRIEVNPRCKLINDWTNKVVRPNPVFWGAGEKIDGSHLSQVSFSHTHGLHIILSCADAPGSHDEYKHPYISFNDNEIKIWQRAPAGNLCHSVFSVIGVLDKNGEIPDLRF